MSARANKSLRAIDATSSRSTRRRLLCQRVPMVGTGELICPSAALLDGGDGVRFTVTVAGTRASAFAVRYGREVHAYLNRCAHRGVELDWDSGRFFDVTRRFLICA